MHARTTALATIAILAATLTACGSDTDQTAEPKGTSASELNQPRAKPAAATVELAWSHTSKDGAGDMQIWYVARAKNPGKSAASVAIDARALDKTGTIVGSTQDTLPNIPAGDTFDYFGNLGGGFTELTGTPAKIEVSAAKDAFGRAGAVDLPMLKTGELKITEGGRDDLFSDAPYSYNLSVKVTNSTGRDMADGVTQQVVLYDKDGSVVGGDSGFSDNVPESLPAGMG
ncbi:hypothetical protein [Streptomyces sp. UG1]|uniref:hypothetical protein n=1 Tax=Streptomyces sp. UG1 TaxID=3417652 RepID=UPI003CE7966F